MTTIVEWQQHNSTYVEMLIKIDTHKHNIIHTCIMD